MKEVTVCLLTGIGNTVMTTPMVEALKKIGYKVQFLIHPWGKILAHMVTGHHYTIGRKTKNYAAVPTLWASSYRQKASKNQIVAKRLDPFHYHESEMNMTVPRELGYKGNTPMPVIYGVKPQTNDTITIATGCTPGKAWRKKKYPHWAQYCRMLSEKHKLSFLGTRDESEGWMGELGENLCGKINLKDAINWIAGCNGMVSIDNGLAHISAALGLPTNVIFGPTLVSKNRQIGEKVKIISNKVGCRPCQLKQRWLNCKHYRCMDIPAKELLQKTSL